MTFDLCYQHACNLFPPDGSSNNKRAFVPITKELFSVRSRRPNLCVSRDRRRCARDCVSIHYNLREYDTFGNTIFAAKTISRLCIEIKRRVNSARRGGEFPSRKAHRDTACRRRIIEFHEISLEFYDRRRNKQARRAEGEDDSLGK